MSSSPVRFSGPGPGGQKRKMTPEEKANMEMLKRIEEIKGNKALLSRIQRPVGK